MGLPKDGGVLSVLHRRKCKNPVTKVVDLAEKRVDPRRFTVRRSGSRHCERWYKCSDDLVLKFEDGRAALKYSENSGVV